MSLGERVYPTEAPGTPLIYAVNSLLRGLYMAGTGETLERDDFWLDVLRFPLQICVTHVSDCQPSPRLPVLYVWYLFVQSDALGFGESLMLPLCDLNKPCSDSKL